MSTNNFGKQEWKVRARLYTPRPWYLRWLGKYAKKEKNYVLQGSYDDVLGQVEKIRHQLEMGVQIDRSRIRREGESSVRITKLTTNWGREIDCPEDPADV